MSDDEVVICKTQHKFPTDQREAIKYPVLSEQTVQDQNRTYLL